ncbi:uncharacterized protein LOC127111019 [Lathyrus oleraceus]|uniref:uncharacterized protein LOC127111019 n=1 Tax=Pisum sativum TaxID=3888 RepID=UPI0021CF7152|nr:uncharacterized protein LOC127111019 [Pisum sativum]
MSQHQDTSASKNTKSTQKVSAPPMGIPDDEILDVVPLSVIPCEALDLNQSIDASTSACSNQGNTSSIPSGLTPAAHSREDKHSTDRVIRNLVTRILNESHSVKGVSTPLSQIYPSPEVEQHSEKDDDSSRQTVSEKGKSVASKTVNASHSEKHDDANVVIDLEDGSYEDQEESLLHHIKPSVAKRMKTRKGKSVVELMSARKAKKTTGIGPSKSWSKVEVKKRKVKDDSESEEDVEEDVPDISPVKKSTVRKSPRRVVVERELGKDAADVKEVMDLIKVVGLLKTVAGFSQCYEGRKIEGAGELEVTNNEVCREITARQVKGWPVKKHLPAGKLTVKYAILHKIGVLNWVPTNHISTIANTLGRFIFTVGTKVKFDYDRFLFEQIIKHASTNAVKLPIAFPSMICGIILNQHPGILCSNDLPSRRKPALSVHYKLFEGSHVEDIVMTSVMKKPTSKVGRIAELKEICKELGEGIRVATARKQSLEALIASLEQAKGENIENANVSHEEEAEAHTSSERSTNNDDTSGNFVSSADEAASSSSTE